MDPNEIQTNSTASEDNSSPTTPTTPSSVPTIDTPIVVEDDGPRGECFSTLTDMKSDSGTPPTELSASPGSQLINVLSEAISKESILEDSSGGTVQPLQAQGI